MKLIVNKIDLKNIQFNHSVGNGYKLVYNDKNQIEHLSFGSSHLITKKNFFATEDFNELVNFIYDNNIYCLQQKNINYKTLEEQIEGVEKLLFKYDD